MTTSVSFDLDAYLARIGLPRPAAADVAALRQLHAAHLASIPFENLDVRLKRPVGLDLESLQAGFVRRRRGGYCFQQNSLFAAALAALGFEVDTLEARVRDPAGADGRGGGAAGDRGDRARRAGGGRGAGADGPDRLKHLIRNSASRAPWGESARLKTPFQAPLGEVDA